MLNISFVGANQVFQDPAVGGGLLHIDTTGIATQEFDLYLLCLSTAGATGPGAGWTTIPNAGKTRVYYRQADAATGPGINVTLALTAKTGAILAVYRGAKRYDEQTHNVYGGWSRSLGSGLSSFNNPDLQGCYVLIGQSDAPQALDPVAIAPMTMRVIGPSSDPAPPGGKQFLADSGIIIPTDPFTVGPFGVDVRSPVNTVIPGRGGLNHAFAIPPQSPFGQIGMSLQRLVACVPGDFIEASFFCSEALRSYPAATQLIITTYAADSMTVTGQLTGSSIVGGSGYSSDTETFTAPANTAFVGLDIISQSASGETGDLLLDDISLKVNSVEQLTSTERDADGTSGAGPPGSLDEWDYVSGWHSVCAILLEQLLGPNFLGDPVPDVGLPGQTVTIEGFSLGNAGDTVQVDFVDPSGGWISTTGTLINFFTVQTVVPPGAGTGPIRVTNLIGRAYTRTDWMHAGSGGWLIGAIGFPGSGSVRRYPTNLLAWRASAFEEPDSADPYNIAPVTAAFLSLGDINDGGQARQNNKALDVTDATGGFSIELRTGPDSPLALTAGDPIQMTGMASHTHLTHGIHLYVEWLLGGVLQGISSLETGRVVAQPGGPAMNWEDVLQEMSPSLAPFTCDAVRMRVVISSTTATPSDTIDRLGLFVEHGLTPDDWTPGA